MNQPRSIWIGLVGLLAGIVFSSTYFATNVSADELPVRGLTLSPLRTELELAPGTSLDRTLTVTNATDKPMDIDVAAEEFSVINQQYDYAFTEESQVAKWVMFSPSHVVLAAGETKTVPFRVSAPLGAEPGGRYISLFASTDTEASNGGVNSRQRIASLLYITVSGDVSRAGNLVSLTSPWMVGGESSWSTAIQNTGTTHFRSRYNVQIQTLLGNHLAKQMAGEALVLPGTVRRVTDVLPLPGYPGIYKVVYTVGLGDQPARVETRVIMYAPAWIWPIIGLVALLTTALLLRRQRRTT